MKHVQTKQQSGKPKGPYVAAVNLYYEDGHEIPAGDDVKGKRLEKALISSGKVRPKNG